MKEKICESCGMPMREIADFGGKKVENKYCRFCTNEEGELKDFHIKLDEAINFIVSRMSIDRGVAEKIAREDMAKMPAWKNYF